MINYYCMLIKQKEKMLKVRQQKETTMKTFDRDKTLFVIYLLKSMKSLHSIHPTLTSSFFLSTTHHFAS